MSFAERVLLTIALVALATLAWYLRDVALLLFGGIVFGVVLTAIARLVRQRTGMSHRLAVAVSVALVLLVAALSAWLIGGAMAEQLSAMSEQVPRAVDSLKRWLQEQPLGRRILNLWSTAAQSIPWAKVAAAAAMTLNAMGLFVLMLLLGIFFAAEPDMYRNGFLRLLPPGRRSAANDGLSAAGDALRGWLKGQGVSMIFVGVATGVGLALLGIPLAMSLGFIAGLLTFVPFFGPIASGLLAVLLAFVEGPQKALYVAGLMLLIEQVQDNVLMPFVQRWAVALPPVLALVSFLVFAALFGPAGMLFATPLMVVLVALTKRLYVEDLLESGKS